MKKAMPILAIGGLWGLLEATLGTLLHLSFFEPAGLWMGSSVIMIPIAYFLLGMLWKATSDAKSILFAGFIAAGIKLTLLAFVFIPGSGIMLRAVINPALSIVLEAALLMVGVIIFKPKSLLSLQAERWFCLPIRPGVLASSYGNLRPSPCLVRSSGP